MQAPLVVELDGARTAKTARDNFKRALVDIDPNDVAYELAGSVKVPVRAPVHAVQAASGPRK